MSCFDYVNSLADLVCGLHGRAFGWQWIVVRNDTGQKMLDLVQDKLETQPVIPKAHATQLCNKAFDKAVTLPMWAAQLMGVVIEKLAPRVWNMPFSIDSHFTTNYLYVNGITQKS